MFGIFIAIFSVNKKYILINPAQYFLLLFNYIENAYCVLGAAQEITVLAVFLVRRSILSS
jgi:hypothetical protein